MIEDNPLEKSYLSNISPQLNKNKKSNEILAITRRLSLMKRHLKKQRDETSLDIIRLKQISQRGKEFQKKVIDQINKCKQLEILKECPKKQENPCGLRKQIKNGDFNEDKKLFNLTDIIHKDNLNLKLQRSEQLFAQNPQSKLQIINKNNQISKKKLKKKNLSASKNLFFFQTSKINFLKGVFITFILLLLAGLALKSLRAV